MLNDLVKTRYGFWHITDANLSNMLSLHYITHAVTLAVIATLIRKYLQLSYDYEDLQLTFQSCHSNIPEEHDGSHDVAELERCKLLIREGLEGDRASYVDKSDEDSSSDGTDIDKSNVPTVSNDLSTSVWCYGHNTSDRFCHFHNLCYFSKHKDFVFVHGEHSLIKGLPEEHFNVLDLSSVEGHNKFYFSFVDVISKPFENITVEWINETSLILSRFKPDNLMHVLHDDILPLYHTLKWITFFTQQLTSFDVQLVFMDGWGDSDFESLYDTLSDHRPISKTDLENSGQVVCFADSFVGISKTTTWYQYGFSEPQGPKPLTESTSDYIHETIQHLLTYLPSEVNIHETGQYLVLISRKENRLILNEVELSAAIADMTKIRVMLLSFETHDIQDMIHIVRGSRGIVGMHGSLMSLSLFLQPGSIIIELFPFAVNPLNYTPYKSLAMIKGMDIIYKPWANSVKDNTIMHPDNIPDYGGIHHLQDSEQDLIKSQTEVPKHLCCSDPSWLFHIYQDTIVDVQDVALLTLAALAEGLGIRESTFSASDIATVTPGTVTSVACLRDVTDGKLSLKLTWEHPWNLPYIEFNKINFEVWLQTVSTNEVVSFMLGNQTTYLVSSHIEDDVTYHVWVRCVIDKHINGQFGNSLNC